LFYNVGYGSTQTRTQTEAGAAVETRALEGRRVRCRPRDPRGRASRSGARRLHDAGGREEARRRSDDAVLALRLERRVAAGGGGGVVREAAREAPRATLAREAARARRRVREVSTQQARVAHVSRRFRARLQSGRRALRRALPRGDRRCAVW